MNPIPSYKSPMNWLKYIFPLGTTQLSLVPVLCKKSVGFLGNWTQPLGDVLGGKFHNRPGGEKSKTPISSWESLDSAEAILQELSWPLILVTTLTFHWNRIWKEIREQVVYFWRLSYCHRSRSKTCYSSFPWARPNDLGTTQFTTWHQTALEEQGQKIPALFCNPLGVFWPRPDH